MDDTTLDAIEDTAKRAAWGGLDPDERGRLGVGS